MSLRTKIALGVLLASMLLAGAMLYLGVEARDQLRKFNQDQHETAVKTLAKNSELQRATAARAVEELVVGWIERMAGSGPGDIANQFREENNGIKEAAFIQREKGDKLDIQRIKPADGLAVPGADESKVIFEVFETRKYKFYENVLIYPYPLESDRPGKTSRVMRLRVNLPPVPDAALPEVETPSLMPLALIAIVTLGVTMVGVFMLLTISLRRFVLSPLGDVLADSKMIVKGTSGLAVKGLRGQGGDEVATLVAAFNGMFAELKAYQSDLEGKVKDATKTIQKQQQSLVIAQRLAATGTLAAGLAHEVNNPLSGMINAARRLKMREGLDERARDYVGLIEEGLGRIEELMKQILDFSRRRDMKPERFDAVRPLRRSAPLVKHRLERRKIQFEEEIHNDLPQVYGNEEELAQVIMNLLINAIDAAPEGGVVRLTVTANAKGGVDYAVEDNGTGVPNEIRDRIFDPFFTTKEPGKGTGLGLAIVHTIATNHGGQVRVEKSEKLGGARFVIELPPADKRESRRLEAPTE